MLQENEVIHTLDLFAEALKEVEAEERNKKRRARKAINPLKKGDIVPTADGDAIIVEYVNASDVRLKFIATGFECSARASNIRKGMVKDRLRETEAGGWLGDTVGYIAGSTPKPSYSAWRSMLQRVQGNLNYKDVLIHPNWLCFETFEAWYTLRFALYPAEAKRLAVDSDIIPFIKGVNKAYRPDTGLLIPGCVNSSFTRTIESLNSFSTDKLKSISCFNETWTVLTLGDRAQFDDRACAIAYATDLLIGGFMQKFNTECLPYLSEIDRKSVENLEQILRQRYC